MAAALTIRQAHRRTIEEQRKRNLAAIQAQQAEADTRRTAAEQRAKAAKGPPENKMLKPVAQNKAAPTFPPPAPVVFAPVVVVEPEPVVFASVYAERAAAEGGLSPADFAGQTPSSNSGFTKRDVLALLAERVPA